MEMKPVHRNEPPPMLAIGDLTLSIKYGGTENNFFIQPTHVPFLVEKGRPDILIDAFTNDLPELANNEVVFESRGTWDLYRLADQWLFKFYIIGTERYLHRILKLDKDFTRGELFIASFPKIYNIDPLSPCILFAYPIDELVIVNYLGHHRMGAVLHAFGVMHDDDGYAFIGVSGAGKSTMAQLWKKAGDQLLSDDRLIVRWDKNQPKIYGTPWHGDAGAASPLGAPLKKIFFLAKSERNYMRPMDPMEVVSRLMICCFPPFYDADCMAFTMELFSYLAAEIPCYELGFVPDEKVVDFVYDSE